MKTTRRIAPDTSPCYTGQEMSMLTAAIRMTTTDLIGAPRKVAC